MENNAEMINELTKLCQEMKRISDKFGIGINAGSHIEYGSSVCVIINNASMFIGENGFVGNQPIPMAERRAV